MMRWLVIGIVMWSGPAFGQEGVVLSGAHPGFTRLTLPLAPDVDWKMGRTANGYGIEIDAALNLDPSQVYSRIDRSRLKAITVGDGMVSLNVDCDCHATAFRYKDTLLVIDIQDGATDPAAPFEQTLKVAPASVSAGERVAASLAQPRRMVLPLSPGTSPIPVAEFGLQAVAPQKTRRQPANAADRAAELIGLERNVLETLSRAASQGLLDLAPEVQANIKAEHDPAAPAQDPNGAENHTSTPHDTSPQQPDVENHRTPTPRVTASETTATPGLLAHTSLDALQNALDAARGWADSGGLCWPPAFTDLPSADDPPLDFGTLIGKLRALVSDDRDRADPEAVAGLARGYLSFGFGEEAIQSLKIDGITDRTRVALRAMAEVIDDLPQSSADLSQQIGCPGSTGLWALLAAARPEEVVKADVDQIVQQFKSLPEAIQNVLGPRLTDLLRLGGRPEMAELVLAPALRMETPPVEAALAEAELLLDRGDVASATATLSELANDDPRMTPQALVQLVDLQLSQGQAVAPETMSLLEAMQFEFRGQPVLADLMRARVGALAHAAAFDTALTLLPDAEAMLQPAQAIDLRSDVVKAIAENGEDMMFLDIAFRPMGRDVAPDVQNEVAARLLTLGFPERAAEIIVGPAIGSVMAERRYVRARAAMDMGDPDTAAAQLAGVQTPRALGILGLESASGPDAIAAENDSAWRNGDWSTLAASDDTLLQEAAALVREDISPVPDTQTPLASGRALIEDATRTRATIDTLMSRYAPPS